VRKKQDTGESYITSSSYFVLLTNYYLGDQIKEDGKRNEYRVFVRKPERNRAPEKPSHRHDTIRIVLKEMGLEAWTGLVSLGKGTSGGGGGCCEHGDEPSGTIK
jgi:hypothetical protein